MSPSGQPSAWSAQQHAWLSAMGYTLYVPGALPLPDDAPVAEPRAPEIAPRAAVAEAPRTAAPRALDSDAPPARVPARPAASRPRPASRLPDRLHFALIRASGCNPNADGAAEIIAQWPASSELRGNAAAKRALWPALRALRRPAGG